MNEAEKEQYRESYKAKKRDGELFFPDAVAKDAIVSLMVFVVLIGLAVLVGVPNEPPADPTDSTYIPRPEWYFLWTFQLLKYFPGKLEGFAILGLGVGLGVLLLGLPFFDRSPKRHPLNRPIATTLMTLAVIGIVFLTIQAVVTTPAPAEGAVAVGGTLEERIAAGGTLYEENCAECHGAEGEGAELPDSPGDFTDPLNSDDFLLTRDRETVTQVIRYGQPGLGMPAFGLPHGGAFADPEIRSIVDFILAWKAPPEEEGAGDADAMAALAAIATPSFAQDVKPIMDKRCATCHSKRLKGGYSVADYDKVMTSGNNAPVIIAGDPANSILVQMLQGIETPAGGQMPPGRPLKEEQIQLIERWVSQGAQNN
jgi:menaquinol-cytochrome c reductase cytochrome b/c subunit